MVGRIPHPKLKGPNLVKEIAMATAAGLAAGLMWKKYQWDLQKKYRVFYEMHEKGEWTVIPPE